MSGAPDSAAPGDRRPRRKPGENRTILLQAGTIEFGMYGYAASHTSAIAQRAGVSQPNVYANFASKEELFLACLDAVLESVTESGEIDEEQSRLVFQGIAAIHHPSLTEELRPRLLKIIDLLGIETFERAQLNVLRREYREDPRTP